jgi:WD40 repeat protein
VYSLAFSADGKLLASASGDGTARLWDVARRRERAALEGHDGSVYCVTFLPGGKALATSGGDRTVRLWDSGGKGLGILRGAGGPVHSLWDVAARSPLIPHPIRGLRPPLAGGRRHRSCTSFTSGTAGVPDVKEVNHG